MNDNGGWWMQMWSSRNAAMVFVGHVERRRNPTSARHSSFFHTQQQRPADRRCGGQTMMTI